MEKEEKISIEGMCYKDRVDETFKSILDKGLPEEDMKDFYQKLIETSKNNGEDKMAEAIEKIKEGVALIKDPGFKGLTLSMVMNELPLSLQLQLYKLQMNLAKTVITTLFTTKVKEETKGRPEVALEMAVGLLQLCKDLKKNK